jgi:hypothetical protein
MSVLYSDDRISKAVLSRISTSIVRSVNAVCEQNILGKALPENAFAVGAF